MKNKNKPRTNQDTKKLKPRGKPYRTAAARSASAALPLAEGQCGLSPRHRPAGSVPCRAPLECFGAQRAPFQAAVRVFGETGRPWGSPPAAGPLSHLSSQEDSWPRRGSARSEAPVRGRHRLLRTCSLPARPRRRCRETERGRRRAGPAAPIHRGEGGVRGWHSTATPAHPRGPLPTAPWREMLAVGRRRRARLALGARWGPAPPRPPPRPLGAGGRRGCAGNAGGSQGRDGRGQRPAGLRGWGKGRRRPPHRPPRPSFPRGGRGRSRPYPAPRGPPQPGHWGTAGPCGQQASSGGTHFMGWLWMGTGVAAESSLPEGSVRLVQRGCGLGVVGGSDGPRPGLNLFSVQYQGFLHRIEREMLNIFLCYWHLFILVLLVKSETYY